MIVRDAPSLNHDERPAGEPVDTLILHYTGMRTAEEAIGRLRDPAVARLGALRRGGGRRDLALGAGSAARLARRSVPLARARSAERAAASASSRQPGHEWGYRPFPALQMAAVCDLCLAIIARHAIAARDVVAHSDVSPDRKQDPGSCSTGKGWRRTASGCGRAPPAERGAPSKRRARRRSSAPSATARTAVAGAALRVPAPLASGAH
jgi:N-acetylmuramoyl-L-alanine amidase